MYNFVVNIAKCKFSNLRSKYMRANVNRMLKRNANPRREATPIQYQLFCVGISMFCSIAIPKLVKLFELYEHQNIKNVTPFAVVFNRLRTNDLPFFPST